MQKKRFSPIINSDNNKETCLGYGILSCCCCCLLSNKLKNDDNDDNDEESESEESEEENENESEESEEHENDKKKKKDKKNKNKKKKGKKSNKEKEEEKEGGCDCSKMKDCDLSKCSVERILTMFLVLVAIIVLVGGMFGIVEYVLPIGGFIISIKLASEDREEFISKLIQLLQHLLLKLFFFFYILFSSLPFLPSFFFIFYS